jgi:peroxiredoxin
MTELITPGEAAPDFALVASDGNAYRLSDVLETSRVMLVFYPGNNTPG